MSTRNRRSTPQGRATSPTRLCVSVCKSGSACSLKMSSRASPETCSPPPSSVSRSAARRWRSTAMKRLRSKRQPARYRIRNSATSCSRRRTGRAGCRSAEKCIPRIIQRRRSAQRSHWIGSKRRLTPTSTKPVTTSARSMTPRSSRAKTTKTSLRACLTISRRCPTGSVCRLETGAERTCWLRCVASDEFSRPVRRAQAVETSAIQGH